MSDSEGDFNSFSTGVPSQFEEWGLARASAQRFRQALDLDSFALQHYKRFPKHPPDQFDRILWGHPQKLRLHNRSSAKWKRVNSAVGPSGLITRLSEQLIIRTFITFSLRDIGFTSRDSDYRNYHDKPLMTEVKEALKEQINGSAWYSLEVSRGEFAYREGEIHGHALVEHDAFSFNAFAELVYEPRTLFRYLIKGIPYNANNLAVFWKAKKLLPKGKQLVRKTGTIRVPYAKTLGF